MGRIHILPDQVANQIAAGEVVERPAAVVKELLENALDAGAGRIRIEVEGGGRKLIRVTDDGKGMMRDDALLAFERHATSKLRTTDDLLAIATLGFRGEALPSIASVSRLELATRAAGEAAGTRVTLAGGKVLSCEEDGIPGGTLVAVRDLFYNTPARRKFLKSETTELAHITALVTHYALAYPGKHFELHSASHELLVAPPVATATDRVFQIFGKDTLDQLIPIAAETVLDHVGLPQPPPWKRAPDYQAPEPGHLRVTGFISKPELQKLNRNSIYCFINRRLIRDRLVMHAVVEAYRNILPPTSFPVVLMFLELPAEEVDVNVHPAKTEVRFRQAAFLHDFVRDSIRTKLTAARPAASFLSALTTHATATPALVTQLSPPGESSGLAGSVSGDGVSPDKLAGAPAIHASDSPPSADGARAFELKAPVPTPSLGSLPFGNETSEAGSPAARRSACFPAEFPEEPAASGTATLDGLASLKPLGQLRESFILAVNEGGFWIVDQHVAHERVLFERILRERKVERVERQRLLMPILIDLAPAQMIAFARIALELEKNGFEAEPYGPRTIAVKSAPSSLAAGALERMLTEVLEQAGEAEQAENLETVRTRIAASIACHAAIKVNTRLDQARMEWLLAELAKTEHPTSCPHGRPIALRYSWKEIQQAFRRI